VWTTDRVAPTATTRPPGTNGDYTAFSGTSAATPLAAGIGALLLSTDTNLTRSQVRARLRASCEKVGEVTYTAGTNLFYGYGRVNAYRALLTNDLPARPSPATMWCATSGSTSRPGRRRSGRPTRWSRPGW
jgi:subtilisin family serine protease